MSGSGAVATTNRHDVLLLDFGGVCLLNPVELHNKVERFLDIPTGTFSWMGPVDPETDELWRRMIAGEGITERDYWAIRAAEVGATAGRDLSVREYMILLYDPPTPEIIRPQAITTVTRALDAGYGVSILTNDMRTFQGRKWEQNVDFLNLVDHIIDCSDTGILKPDPRAFEYAKRIVGTAATRILYVDDQPLNVAAGTRAGFDSALFDVANPVDAWADVARRLEI